MYTYQKFQKIDNFHILLWLFKDLCWCANFKVIGLIMIFPTLAVAIYSTFIGRIDRSIFTHNLAVVFWIGANSVWMIGEFFLEDSTRPFTLLLFFSGIVVLMFHYLPLLWQKLR